MRIEINPNRVLGNIDTIDKKTLSRDLHIPFAVLAHKDGDNFRFDFEYEMIFERANEKDDWFIERRIELCVSETSRINRFAIMTPFDIRRSLDRREQLSDNVSIQLALASIWAAVEASSELQEMVMGEVGELQECHRLDQKRLKISIVKKKHQDLERLIRAEMGDCYAMDHVSRALSESLRLFSDYVCAKRMAGE